MGGRLARRPGRKKVNGANALGPGIRNAALQNPHCRGGPNAPIYVL